MNHLSVFQNERGKLRSKPDSGQIFGSGQHWAGLCPVVAEHCPDPGGRRAVERDAAQPELPGPQLHRDHADHDHQAGLTP